MPFKRKADRLTRRRRMEADQSAAVVIERDRLGFAKPQVCQPVDVNNAAFVDGNMCILWIEGTDGPPSNFSQCLSNIIVFYGVPGVLCGNSTLLS